MVPDETSDLPTTLPEASFLNPNRKVPSEARSLRGLFPVPVFAEFPSYSLSKNADGFLQNPFWLSYCNLRKLKQQTKRYRNFLVLCKKRAGPPCLLLKGTVLLFFRVFTIRYCFCRSFRSGSFRFSYGYFSPHSAFFDYFSFLIPPLFPILRCFL